MSVVALMMLPTVMGTSVTRDYYAIVDNFFTGSLSVDVECGGENFVSHGPVYHAGSAGIYARATTGATISGSEELDFWGVKSEQIYGPRVYIHVWGTEAFNPDGTLNHAGTIIYTDSGYYGDTWQIHTVNGWVSWIRITASSTNGQYNPE